MKKFLSILLAVLIMTASCTCAFSVIGADALDPRCGKGHTVTVWEKVNSKSHKGTCSVCNKEVAATHNLVEIVDERVEPTCFNSGYKVYKCSDNGCDYTYKGETIAATGCDIIDEYYDFTAYTAEENKYTITRNCRNSATAHVEIRTLGAANRCPKCLKTTLAWKKVVNPTCNTLGYTEYHCVNAESDCGQFVDDKTVGLVPHKYVKTKVAPTCTTEGYDMNKCIYCGVEFNDEYLPAMGHSMDSPGASYTYTYIGGSCTVIGLCSVCNTSQVVTYDYAAEECGKCGTQISKKIVNMPLDCDDEIDVTIYCPNSSCGNHMVKALSVGHDPITTTYKYNPDGTSEITVDCKICGVNTTEEGEFKDANVCTICEGPLEERVVTAPTCEKGGFVKSHCPTCGIYTELTYDRTNHSADKVEWTYDHTSKTASMKATCNNKGCEGYNDEIAIGTETAKCDRCKKNTLTYKLTVNSNCTYGGYKKAECSYCGSQSNYDIRTQKDHTYIEKEVAPTCTAGGSTVKTCTECYRTTETDFVSALGHVGKVSTIQYWNGTTEKKVSYRCQREGCGANYSEWLPIVTGERKCSQCGANSGIERKTIVAPSCKPNGETFNGYTLVFCGSCPATEREYVTDIVTGTHDYTSWKTLEAATCISKGLRERSCKSCGYIQQQIIPMNVDSDGNPKHNYVTLVPGVDATCTEPGTTPELYCQVCKEFKKSESIKPLGHEFDPYSTNEKFCNRCNSYVIDSDGEETVCKCLCHNKDDLAALVFRFLCFFYQLFGIMQTCDCGTVHY